MKNSLSEKGLSMSSAASISNLCNQRANDISVKLANLNNARVTFNVGENEVEYTQGNPIPDNIKELLTEKAELHGAQAFLMTNIKAKEALLSSIKNEVYTTKLIAPQVKELAVGTFLKEVDEEWGKAQLSIKEVNEFLHQESLASHYGQFIHKGSILETLRRDLGENKSLEFVSLKDGERIPLLATKHHTQENLSLLHEELSALHRKAEARVNYFKAKVKNLVTEENARIANVNGKEQARVNDINGRIRAEYMKEFETFSGLVKEETNAFEEDRNKRLKVASQLRIEVSPLFKKVIDKLDLGESGEK